MVALKLVYNNLETWKVESELRVGVVFHF